MIREEGDARHYCPNENGCPTQIKGRIQHFISRKAMNIDGLGAETVDLLVEEGLISNVADLYDLTFDQIFNLERMAEKSANNLLKGLKESNNVPFSKVLFGLGIRFVGETVAKKLAKEYKNIDALMQADFDALIAVDEIGDRIANSILQYFEEPKHQELINRLKKVGLQFEIKEKEGASNLFEGKSFVVSGVFTNFSRNELKELIETNGGKNVSSISKKTSCVVAGDKMGPAKLKKATDLGIEILSENDFIALLNEK